MEQSSLPNDCQRLSKSMKKGSQKEQVFALQVLRIHWESVLKLDRN